mgnify:CR=1 FL=1
MKKYILPAFCSLLLSLPSQAQKNGQAIPAPTAEYYMNHYQFDEAEELLNQDIKKLKRKRQPTDVEEGKLQEIARLRSMMRATERVTVIDSLVVDKNTFLNHIKLSPESGEISPYSTFFHRTDENGCTVYLSELGNKIYFAQPDENKYLRLFTSDLVGGQWTAPHKLDELDGDDAQNYPFMLSDGITLYYAAQGEESIGGYDIFVTRYDMDEKKFLYPENLGMPFNSPANDYMLAIDEFNQLGWFVSDRNQPENKVCIYIFIPNDIRRIVCKHIDRPQFKMLFQHPNVIIDHFLCLSFDSDHQTRRIEQFRHLLRCCKSCVFIQILLAKFIVKRFYPYFEHNRNPHIISHFLQFFPIHPVAFKK